MTPAQCQRRSVSQGKPPDLGSAAFRDEVAAADWAVMAAKVTELYAVRAMGSAKDTAHAVSGLNTEMAELLRFAYSKAVQQVLKHPLLKVDLTQPERFDYALVSPFLSKVYIGLVGRETPRAPYQRLREHLSLARNWSSRHSGRRFNGRTPDLYRAIAKVGIGNGVQVILAQVETAEELKKAERAYIRHFSPVFNVVGVGGEQALPRAVMKVLGSSASDDVRVTGARVLRKNHPRLPAPAWVELIAQVLRTGDRDLGAKLARLARQVCPQLAKLRSAPRLVFPCPVPATLLRQLRSEVRSAMKALPFVRRSMQYNIMVEATAVCWSKTPYAETVLSPSQLPLEEVGACCCGSLPGTLRRCEDHVICRDLSLVPCCARLWRLAGEQFAERLEKYLKQAGFKAAEVAMVKAEVVRVTLQKFQPWMQALPAMMKQRQHREARRHVWKSGMVLIRVDRSPGRVVVMCVELWKPEPHLPAKCSI